MNPDRSKTAARARFGWVAAFAGLLLASMLPGTAFAQLAQRHSFNVNGNVQMVGNGLLTCTTGTGNNTNCAGSQNGTSANNHNGGRTMQYIHTASAGLPAGAPANSSTANLVMPAGAQVLSAGLYWSGRWRTADGGGEVAANRWNIYLKRPGDAGYTQLQAGTGTGQRNEFTGSISGLNNTNWRPYTAHVDVTAQVRQAGAGTYAVGGLSSQQGAGDTLGYFGGWALIVIYQHASEPFRRLMVFDGNAGYVQSGGSTSATVSGLLTPPSGNFNSYMGALVWEGDEGYSGDSFSLTGSAANVLNGGALSDAVSPIGNFWNSRISRLGSQITARNPAYVNNFAVDLKLVDISNTPANAGKPRMANSATGATLTFATNQDAYFPHALVFVSDLYSPNLLPSLQKTVSNITRPGATDVRPGEQLEYTIKFQNTGQDGAIRIQATDPIPAGTTYVPGTLRVHRDDGLGINAPAGQPRTDASGDDTAEFVGNEVRFRVGAGANATQGGMLALNQAAELRFRVTVDAGFAGTQIVNTVTVTHGSQTFPNDPDQNVTGSTSNNIQLAQSPSLAVAKTGPATAVVGVPYDYVIAVTNGGAAATTAPATVTDTIPNGLTINGTPAGCAVAGQVVTCTIAAGLSNVAPGNTTSFTINVTPTAAAGASVSNAASVVGGGDPNCPVGTPCTSPPVETTLGAPNLMVAKAGVLDNTVVAPPGASNVGDVVNYTITVSNTGTGAATGVNVVDAKLPTLACVLGAVAQALPADIPAGQSLVCTGAYALTQSDIDAGAVDNTATATGANVCRAGVDPVCSDTETTAVTQSASLTVVKSVTSSGPYTSGSTISYQFLVTNTGNVALTNVTVTDPLAGLSAISCPSTTLAVGAAPMACTATYTVTAADVNAGNVHNSATASGTPPATPTNPTPGPITTPPSVVDTPIAQAPSISVTKQALLTTDNGTAGVGNLGDVITYTVLATNTGNVTLTSVSVMDSFQGGTPVALTCAPTTLAPGQVAVCDGYTHTITQAEVNANQYLENTATASGQFTAQGGTGGTVTVTDDAVATVEIEADPHAIRIVKTAAVREVNIGDLVRYTLTVENVGTTHLVGGSVIDTPPAGFTYVEGSLSVVDGDNAATVSGQHPLRFDGVDVAAGQSATLTYLMRVGAGVRPGNHVNQAQAHTRDGTPVSNIATAEVDLVADALLDDSLIFGTVFDDRDGDGWQDGAGLSGIKVQGGFAPGAYVANSTTVDRGQGHQPQADASSPLLHGIAIGSIGGRQSAVDQAQRRQVVVRQRLNELAFTSDFVLSNDQGVTVRMDATGNTTVEQSGDAAKGLNSAEPTVERKVSAVEGGYVVDYVIRNQGVEERGIPGVRIASVEGLLIETDQFGRYHLAGVNGGNWARGRNFILKVDPSTLPAGTEFTTDNPLLRRVTPGLPVRFDWGVKLPVVPLEGKQAAELELGEVIFAPGSAEVRTPYLPVIDAIAAKIEQYQGGDVVIKANGHTDTMALARAEAVKQALLEQVSAKAASALVVGVRTDVGDPDSLVIGVDEGGYVLGLVLFDTDKSAIRPEFKPLLDRVAQVLQQRGEGVVTLIGHTDVRGSHAYNTALGMRRAKAVQEALAERLSPEVRARVRVDVRNEPTAPVGMKR